MASHLVKALVNVRGEGTPSGSKGYSFKEFYEHPLPMFKGNLNSGEVRVWLTSLEELLRVMDCTEEQRVKYIPTSSLERQGVGGTLRGTRW